jgi:hypothetical protein
MDDLCSRRQRQKGSDHACGEYELCESGSSGFRPGLACLAGTKAQFCHHNTAGPTTVLRRGVGDSNSVDLLRPHCDLVACPSGCEAIPEVFAPPQVRGSLPTLPGTMGRMGTGSRPGKLGRRRRLLPRLFRAELEL